MWFHIEADAVFTNKTMIRAVARLYRLDTKYIFVLLLRLLTQRTNNIKKCPKLHDIQLTNIVRVQFKILNFI